MNMDLMDTTLWYDDRLETPWMNQPVVFDNLEVAKMIAFAIVWRSHEYLYYGDLDFWSILQPQIDQMVNALKEIKVKDIDGWLASDLICSDGFNKLKPAITQYLHKICK